MKKIFSLLMLLSMLVCSCANQDAVSPEIKSGTYTGYFSRSAPNIKYRQSEVNLTFENGQFEGNSTIEKYPTICKGAYKIAGQQIEFENACPWTTEFDWTYILAGRF